MVLREGFDAVEEGSDDSEDSPSKASELKESPPSSDASNVEPTASAEKEDPCQATPSVPTSGKEEKEAIEGDVEGEEEDDGEEEEEYDEEEQAYLQEQDEQQRRANEDSAHLAGHMIEQEAVATGQTSLTRGQSRVEAVHLQSSTGASPKQEAPLLAKAKSIVEAHDSPSGGGGRGLSRRASRDA